MKHRAPWLGIALAAIPLVWGAGARGYPVRPPGRRPGPGGPLQLPGAEPTGRPAHQLLGRQPAGPAFREQGRRHVDARDGRLHSGDRPPHVAGPGCAAGSFNVSYWDATHGDLKYASHSPAGWTIETVDSVGVVGEYTSLALDATGRPHISYYDATNGDLKYAPAGRGSSWTLEIVDGSGDVGRYTRSRWTRAVTPHIRLLRRHQRPSASGLPVRAAYGGIRDGGLRGTTSAAMLRSRSTARAILSSAISTPRAATSSTRAARRGSGARRP